MGKYISLPVFLASFAFGILFIYLIDPEKKTVFVYPSPETVGKVLFKDRADNCFYFEEAPVDCPTDELLISDIPIQE